MDNISGVPTALSVVFLLDVGHQSTGSFAHLAEVVVVCSVGRADRPAVDRVAVAVARLHALTASHQAVHRRHAVGPEAARLPGARVLYICRIDITPDRRRRQDTQGQREKKDGGD